LTRIEMRIEKLLKRDEIAGFEAFDRRPKPGPLPIREGTGPADTAGQTADATPEEQPKKPPAAALLGKGRAPKRFRRAL
jgi:hypothetical protein